jgi:hypothetical protein
MMKQLLHKVQFTILPATFFCLSLLSCNNGNKQDNKEEVIQTMDPKDIRISPVVHDTLSKTQLEEIKRIQEVFAEVNPSTLEETITDFKRDKNPDNEIAIWLQMAAAYEKFTSKSAATLDLEKKKEAYKLILMRSMASEKEALKGTDIKLLTEQEIADIFSYYQSAPKPLTVEHR